LKKIYWADSRLGSAMLDGGAVSNIRRLKQKYLMYRAGREGREFEESRRRREETVRRILSEPEALDRSRLLALVSHLYSFEWWRRKEWVVDYWIEGAGGLDRLREELRKLLDPGKRLSERIDAFSSSIKGFGAATLTEMLTYYSPREYGIWNKKVKKALLKLGISRVGGLDLNKLKTSNIRGEDYEALIQCLKEIAELLRDEARLSNPDLLDVDYFLYYVAEVDNSNDGDDGVPDHDEVVERILSIGQGLGFDVGAEVPVAVGARVDAVWVARIGNLGELRYVFEVHIKGSMDSLILNLLRAAQDPTVQKVVAVADEQELERMRKEAEHLSPLRDKLLYWRIEEVLRASDLVEELMTLVKRLGLTRHS